MLKLPACTNCGIVVEINKDRSISLYTYNESGQQQKPDMNQIICGECQYKIVKHLQIPEDKFLEQVDKIIEDIN